MQYQLTRTYTPQQNGFADRMNRTLMECVRSSLLAAKMGRNSEEKHFQQLSAYEIVSYLVRYRRISHIIIAGWVKF